MYASVSGGSGNTASGFASTIGGGGAGGGKATGLTESNDYGWAAGTKLGAPTVPVYEAH